VTAIGLERELQSLPEEQRAQVIRSALGMLSAGALKDMERQVRRLAHHEVPEDVWIGFEEAEDGQGAEIRDEHFNQPPA
jgi:hypothetical protein